MEFCQAPIIWGKCWDLHLYLPNIYLDLLAECTWIPRPSPNLVIVVEKWPFLLLTVQRTLEKGGKIPKGGKTSHRGGKPPSTPPGKKKTPSQRRRDRERFRAWLVRRKSLQVQKTRNTSPDENKPVSSENYVQCSPPLEATVRVAQPKSVTISGPTSVTAPSEPDLRAPVDLDCHKCICDLCSMFKDIDPFQKYHQSCDNCGKVATKEQPLKPCARCLACAYCGKECQTSAWKAKHKAECSKEIGEQVRAAKESWSSAREIWLKHKTEPFHLPPTV